MAQAQMKLFNLVKALQLIIQEKARICGLFVYTKFKNSGSGYLLESPVHIAHI